MEYEVKYRTSKQWFWRTIKRVKADGFIDNTGNRFFILFDETRIEVPNSAEFRFSKDRFSLILKNMEKESGQKIPVDSQ